MESKQTTPSVIAKLMGFDELRPQHVAPRPVKVFSEDYLRKIASIAMLEKSSVHLNHSLSGTGGKHHSSVHLNHLPSGSEGKQHDNKQVFDVKPNQSTVLARLGFARQKIANGSDAYPIDLQNFHADQPKDVPKHLLEARTSSKMSSKRVVLKSAQKFGDHSGESGADLGDLSRTPSELKDKASNLSKIVVLNPNSRNVHPYGRSLFIGSDALHQGSNGDYMEHESCLKPARKIILNENKSRDLVGDIRLVDKKAALEESMEARINLRGSSRTRSIVKVPSVHLSEASITPCQGFFNLRKRQKISNQVLNGSSYSRVANSNIFERWKAAKYSGELAVPGRRITSGQMFAVHDGAKLETISSSESFSSPKDNSELCISMFHRSKVISTNEYIRNLPSPVRKENSVVADPDPESSIEASQSKCHGLKETGTGYNFSSNTIHSGGNDILPLKVNQGFQDESDSYMVKEANGHGLTDSGDDFFHQKSSYNSFKGELILTCTAGDLGDLGSVKNLRENYQASPDSVLEPALKEEDGQFSESSCSFTDLRGLAMKLNLLNNESLEEISSEGSVMAVSSDGDTEKGSVDLSEDCQKQWGPSRPEESRDFSYLIDVLDEAVLFGLHLHVWSEAWHETENPLSPSVFEALEKKYGKQTSWPKSERRLLFDYINSGLRSIQDSYLDFGLSEKPLRKRLKATLSKDDIEEELWMQLTHEKEAKRDSSEKAFGSELKWLELDEDISIICKEIVDFLFDELATEICST